jgi:leader peptidase (prepilin peptidase)/N-methyltransferase
MTSATGLTSVLAALTVSPLLAAWTLGLTPGCDADVTWWHPRRVPAHRLVIVAAVAAVLAGSAAGGTPLAAWWLFATGGAVLCIVDAEHHLLPARMVYPFAAVILTALALAEVLAGEPDRLLRAFLAAAVVGGMWFTVAFLAPPAVGLGDVRVAALAAGLLGWTGWSSVLAGQLAAFGLAAVTAGIIAATAKSGRATQVPMGPALIVGALAAAWL